MLVEIKKEIFKQSDEENLMLLNKLWNTVERRHILLLRDIDCINALKNSAWYSQLFDSQKEIINQYINKSGNSSSREIANCVISLENNLNHFTIIEAIKYLEQPFTLILENSHNDAHFINCLIKHFRRQSKTLKTHLEERWVEFGMGGGSTILDTINTKLQSFSSMIFPKDKLCYLRFFVLTDSDKNHPETPLDSHKINLRLTLEQYKIPYHFLEKREMENYLPDEAFSEIKNNTEFIQAYLKLTPIQKDYFDLEKGFSDKNFKSLNPKVQDLYESILESSKSIFRANDLKKINSTEENFKKNFPELFLSEKVTKDNLLERCAHHYDEPNKSPHDKRELLSIIDKITKAL
jgi:hypothetical protein